VRPEHAHQQIDRQIDQSAGQPAGQQARRKLVTSWGDAGVAPGERRAPGPRPLGRLRRGLGRRRDVLALISLGGAVGSVGRWGVAEALPHQQSAFPWATALTNVTGCFALGVLMVLALEVWPPSRYLRPFFGVGVLGGYTTFSTAMLETRSLVATGRPALAAGYALGTTAAGIGAVAVAVVLTRVVFERRR
jgi:fluoride exporter